MASQTRKQSTKGAMPLAWWACCKCSSLNASGPLCLGYLALRDVADEPCGHWHCPTCRPVDETPPVSKRSGRGSIATPPAPVPSHAAHADYHHAEPYFPSADHHAHHTHHTPYTHHRCHHHHHDHEYVHDHDHIHDHPHPPPHRPPPDPNPIPYPSPPPASLPPTPRYPYTKAYLRGAAARSGPHPITFAEAFPAPASLPCDDGATADTTLALAGLRFDYSRGGGRGPRDDDGDDDGDDDDDGEGNSWHGEGCERGRAGRCGRRGDGDEDIAGEGEDKYSGGESESPAHGGPGGNGAAGGRGAADGYYPRRDRETERDGDAGGGERWSGGLGSERRKRKAEREREKSAGSGKKRDKGKGKARARYAWGQPLYPSGYQPASVEDVLDSEMGGRRYGYGGELEEEW